MKTTVNFINRTKEGLEIRANEATYFISFYDPARFLDKKHKEYIGDKSGIYLYYDEIPSEEGEGWFAVKLGWAKTLGSRLNVGGSGENRSCVRVLGVWLPPDGTGKVWNEKYNTKGDPDKIFHAIYRKIKKGKFYKFYKRESYLVNGYEGLDKFKEEVDKIFGVDMCDNSLPFREDYKDLIEDCDELLALVNEGERNFCCGFATRYGKDSSKVRCLRVSDNRIALVAYFIHNVAGGCEHEIRFKQNNRIKWIALTSRATLKERVAEAERWLAKNTENKVMFGLPLTDSKGKKVSDSIYEKRINSIRDLLIRYKSCFFVDESDFGADKGVQTAKFRTLCEDKEINFSFVATMTGTNYVNSANRLFGDKPYRLFVRTYSDIVKARPEEAVVPSIITFPNDMIIKYIGSDNVITNWDDAMEIDEEKGTFIGENYFRFFIMSKHDQRLFEARMHNAGINLSRKEIHDLCLKNKHGANLICGLNEKKRMEAMKRLIEGISDDARVKILNSDEDGVSTATAEREACEFIENVKRNGGDVSKVYFIGDQMVSRSWSVMEVKNIFLFGNAGNPYTAWQKMARSLTPYRENGVVNKEKNKAYIFDYQLGDNSTSYLGAATLNAINEKRAKDDGAFTEDDFPFNAYIMTSDASGLIMKEVSFSEKMRKATDNLRQGGGVSFVKGLLKNVKVSEVARKLYLEKLKKGKLYKGKDVFRELVIKREWSKKGCSMFRNQSEGFAVSGKKNECKDRRNENVQYGENDEIMLDEAIKEETVGWLLSNVGIFYTGIDGCDSVTSEWKLLKQTERGRSKYKGICEKERRDYELIVSLLEELSNININL